MKLILCSFVVLVSTSKPQSMSSKLLLVSELHYDFDLFAEILHTPSLSLRSYAPPKFRRAANFGRIDHQDHDLESLRIFFCDRAHVYTLCEKYIQPFLRTPQTSKTNVFFFVTEFDGHIR